MAISLAVAFVVTPWLAAQADEVARRSATATAQPIEALDAKLDSAFRKLLTPFPRSAQGVAPPASSWPSPSSCSSLGSVSLAYFQLVVLKMLPFDNKSEFQIVVDLPVGTPVEETARVLHEIGAELARDRADVVNYQAYAGTASPINFNGLVRQYYLRAAPEKGDIQVNLADKHHRTRQSHEIAVSVRERIEAIGKRNGGVAKVVEVPPGPPVMSPIVAEVYGPDYAGQMAVGKQVRKAFEQTPDIVAVDDYIEADSRKFVLHVLQNKAAQLGVAQSDIVEVVGMGLAGIDVTPARNTESKFEIPVRVDPAGGKTVVARGAAQAARPFAATAGWCRSPSWSRYATWRAKKPSTTRTCVPVVYVVGDMGGKLDSPLYGMFDIRSKINGMALKEGGTLGEWFIRQPPDPYAGYSVKWDGEWQVTYETFRDMGIAYAVGLILIYLLVVAHFGSYLVPLIIMAPIPLTIIGVMPGHALFGSQFTATSMIGMIALAGIIVRNSILLVDFIKQQVAAGMNFARCGDPVRRRARQADRADRAGRHARRPVHPRRPHLQRPRPGPDLRHTGFHAAHAGGDPGSLLRSLPQGASIMTIERIIRIMAGFFVLLSLALGWTRQPDLRLRVVPRLHGLRRPQPAAKRLHRLLSAGKAARQDGLQAQQRFLRGLDRPPG